MSKEKRCGQCLWRDECEFDAPCDYYCDGNENDLDDYQIGLYIEERRREFYREWSRYISQYE